MNTLKWEISFSDEYYLSKKPANSGNKMVRSVRPALFLVAISNIVNLSYTIRQLFYNNKQYIIYLSKLRNMPNKGIWIYNTVWLIFTFFVKYII